jgi:predicted nucleotidyltransferase/uncharacterized protein with HEPN domain
MEQRVVKTAPLTREEAMRILNAHEQEIRAQGVTRLALFGSTVRNEARNDSDVDLLAEIDPARQFSLLDWAGLEAYFADLLARDVEVTICSDLKPYARGNILAEAVEVFPCFGSRIARSPNEPLRHPQRQRLQDILDTIVSIESNAAIPAGEHPDDPHQAALEREVGIISNAARRLPAELTDAYPSVAWRQIGEIGEVLRYHYDAPANRQLVHSFVENDLAVLKAAIDAMIAGFDRREGR